MNASMADKSYYLYPGGLFAEAGTQRVTTVLGSCVAVCLWDPLRKIGGINHYLLPLWNGEGLPTPRYGNIAIEALVNRMRILGADRSRMQAKIFGGATMWECRHNLFSVGERNVELAIRVLDSYRIPITANAVGGENSRKIIFNTGSGEVFMRRSRGSSAAATG